MKKHAALFFLIVFFTSSLSLAQSSYVEYEKAMRGITHTIQANESIPSILKNYGYKNLEGQQGVIAKTLWKNGLTSAEINSPPVGIRIFLPCVSSQDLENPDLIEKCRIISLKKSNPVQAVAIEAAPEPAPSAQATEEIKEVVPERKPASVNQNINPVKVKKRPIPKLGDYQLSFSLLSSTLNITDANSNTAKFATKSYYKMGAGKTLEWNKKVKSEFEGSLHIINFENPDDAFLTKNRFYMGGAKANALYQQTENFFYGPSLDINPFIYMTPKTDEILKTESTYLSELGGTARYQFFNERRLGAHAQVRPFLLTPQLTVASDFSTGFGGEGSVAAYLRQKHWAITSELSMKSMSLKYDGDTTMKQNSFGVTIGYNFFWD